MRKVEVGEIVRFAGKTGKLVKMETPVNSCHTCVFDKSHTTLHSCPANIDMLKIECVAEGLEFEDVIPVKDNKIIVIGVTEIITD